MKPDTSDNRNHADQATGETDSQGTNCDNGS